MFLRGLVALLAVMKLGDYRVKLVKGEYQWSAEAHEPGQSLDDLAWLLLIERETEGFPFIVFKGLPLKPGQAKA